MSSRTIAFALLCVAAPTAAFAQSEAALKSFFEGHRVTVKMDMPATSSGVDVYPHNDPRVNYKDYGERLKVAGISLRAGETSTITLIKVKKDLIEFQIGGGGFGNDSGYVAPDYVGKSNREKQLEKDVKNETDPARKRRLQDQLDDERRQREREERRNRALAASQQAANKVRIAQERLHAGSRFNLRYGKDKVPTDLRPDDIVEILSPYVDFNPAADAAAPAAAAQGNSFAPPAAPRGSDLPRKGMTRAEMERDFGRPQESSERREGTLRVVTLVFVRGEQRISGEFVEDVLIRYTISSR